MSGITSSSVIELHNISTSPTSDPENPRSVVDPFSLSVGIKSDEEISTLTARHRKNASRWPYTGGRLLGRGAVTVADPQAPPMPKVKQKIDVKGIKEFYESQNESIQQLLKPVEDHVREAKEEHGDNRIRYLIAVNGSFAANIVLAILQLYGAIASGSLSLFTTMADSIFDPLSNLLLILSHRAVNKVDANRFPSGKARIETAGNILFCFLMCAVSLILIVMSARDIAAHNDSEETTGFHLPSIIAVGVAFGTKFTLFLYCWSLRNTYSQVRILWEDHRNDLFINGFGILTSVGGSKLRWWIDPAGAIVLSFLILGLWSKTAYGEFMLLIGVSADNSMLRLITYISMTHSDQITQIDTVRAYHSGPRIIVEVDIVMCANSSLRVTHDVAEELQIKLESLPDVERAYVHVDYETSHKPEHFLKKEL
ncbi:uncharacterized protein LAJ45_02195 [Morchella importuna]|uniref:Uncharacterized protein n=1 Tax=Morchella conica CCBAS932 TaxID=1392247 RepID=A0A3N4KV08_9PEZI|nr:uncharacterized protein LAJ45_02195 [Morchella importuna]KAH8153383.1 hypothetical protein LAJ45_02195 [Morchella importuna]RPB13249.1 hypothetical protein P167DRAFT_136514 [Morchella conica CCBAS932]